VSDWDCIGFIAYRRDSQGRWSQTRINDQVTVTLCDVCKLVIRRDELCDTYPSLVPDDIDAAITYAAEWTIV